MLRPLLLLAATAFALRGLRWESDEEPTTKNCKAWITWVARSVHDKHEFRRRARRAAEQLGPGQAERLGRITARWRAPRDVASQFAGLGTWMEAWQAAVFQILAEWGAASLPVYLRVARGPYDCHQWRSIAALCQLALDGIESDFIVLALSQAIGNWRPEAIDNACHPLCQLGAQHPVLMEAFHRVLADGGVTLDKLEWLEALGRHAPAELGPYRETLYGIAGQSGRGLRDPLLDGQVVARPMGLMAISGPAYPSVQDFHAIRASLLIDRAWSDAGVRQDLEQWAQTHPVGQVRRELRDYLDRG